MLLRAKIFRQLVLFAVMPSLIIAAVASYLLLQAINQASVWLAVSAPDRTINSLRLTETRLQELARHHLDAADIPLPPLADTLLDWRVVMQNERVIDVYRSGAVPADVDSILRIGWSKPGLIRRMAGDNLLLGAAVDRGERIYAGGYVLDREYLSGFQAATETLKESRRFQNILPGFILFLLAAGVIVLIAVVITASFLSRRLSASVTIPLEQLTALTMAVTQGGRPQPIKKSGTDEIVRLTETFNRMIVDLDESRTRLIAAERVAAWQEFARRMAHELKNPLTPISLSLYRIKKTLEEGGQYARFADSIEAITAEVAHLERLATDYSSLAGLPEPRMRAIELTALVRDLIHLYTPQLESFQFEERLPSGPINMEGDPDHLHQVMVNLLKNALEFTPHGGSIRLAVTDDEHVVSFEVANAAGDVNEADLKAAKLPYVSTRKGGTGLGLAVSEKIIIDHGGTLTIGLENGMTVTRFEIPRHRSGGIVEPERQKGNDE